MANIGRNDPCPCSSGKKYKKCCLAKTYVEIGKEESIKQGLVQEILAFAKKRFGDYIDNAYDYFWDDFDPERNLSEELFRFSDINFWEWFVYDWIPDEKDSRTLIEHFKENNKKLSLDELKVLNMMNNAVISLYEVQDVFFEKGLLLKDLLMGGEYDVREKMATRSARKWDIFAGRLLHVDGKYILSGAIYPYSVRQKEGIIKAINKWFKDYKKDYPDGTMDDFLKSESDMFNFFWYSPVINPPEIKLATISGEALLLSEAIFEIKDRDRVIEGLKRVKEFRQEDGEFVWLAERDEDGSATVLGRIEIKDNKLTLECNSKKRLSKGKEIILKHIDEFIVHKIDTFQDPFKAMKTLKDMPEKEVEDEIPFEIKQELYTQFMKKHCEKWLNMKIHALNGKTPVESVRTEKGRQKVIELLKSFENTEEHNKREGRPYCDISWMWERLGLVREV